MPEGAKIWPGLSDDLGRLETARGKRKTGRIAITSYEFAGVVRNGGIGTACTELAKALARDGHEVELIFTGWWSGLSPQELEHWRAYYLESNIRLIRVDPAVPARFDAVIPSAAHSMALYQLLKERDEEQPYDVIHFVESLGHGFYSLLARRQQIAFKQAITVVGIHSPRRWIAEAHHDTFDLPMDVADEYLEDRGIEMADVVISPSHFMLNWLKERGVALPPRSYVQQYVTHFDDPDKGFNTPHPRRNDHGESIEELVFFGRLEPRKGVVEFCDALDTLAKRRPGRLKKVTFLGKDAMPEFVDSRARKWLWDTEVISNLDRDAALEYLQGAGRLAVMASKMDNSPNVIYEAIGMGIPFLSSRGGGSGELVHPDDRDQVTYDPQDHENVEIDPANPARRRPKSTGAGLAERLQQLLDDGPPKPARFAVPTADNRMMHLDWHRAAVGSRIEADRRAGHEPSLPVSILIGDLTSSVGSDSVLVVDDETEPALELGSVLADVAALRPDASFITSLGAYDVETSETSDQRTYLPTGGPLSTALVSNTLGAGAVLARRDALERLEIAPDDMPFNVAELLLRAVLAGELVEVVPRVLYHLPASVAPDGSLTRAEDRVRWLRPFYERLTPSGAEIATLAARVLRDEPELRAAAVRSVATSQQLSEILSSRSMRLTAALRRANTAVRAVKFRRRNGRI
jgi:glycosyltransferase involved in cell wall biosynthesis